MSNSTAASTYTGLPGSTNYALYNSFTPAQLNTLSANYTYDPTRGGYVINGYQAGAPGGANTAAAGVTYLPGLNGGSNQAFIPAANPSPQPAQAPTPVSVPQPVQAPTPAVNSQGGSATNLESTGPVLPASTSATATPPASTLSPSDQLMASLIPGLLAQAQNGGSASNNAMQPASTSDLAELTPTTAPTTSSGPSTVILIVILLIVAGGGYWWWSTHHKKKSSSSSSPSSSETSEK